MKYSSKILIAALILICFASSAHGYRAVVTPRISVSEEYSTNIFLASIDPQEDFITLISPGFTLDISEKNNGINLSYDLSHSSYRDHSERNTFRHFSRLSAGADITKHTRIDFLDTFIRTEDPLIQADIAAIRTQDPTAPIDSTVRQDINPYTSNLARLNLTHQLSESNAFNLGYAYRFLNNDDPTIEDSQRHNPFAGITYWFSPQWGLEVTGSYIRGDFESSDDLDGWTGDARLTKRFSSTLDGHIRYSFSATLYEGETEDDFTHNPAIGINYALEEDVSLALDVGFFQNNYELRGDESGLTLDGRLVKQFERGSVRVSTIGGYDYSFFGAENLGFERFAEAGVSATYFITRQIRGNASGSYRYSNYVDTIPEREDDIVRAGINLTYQPFRWMSIGLDYSYRLIDSNIPVNDYDVNRIYLVINLFSPTPYRLK